MYLSSSIVKELAHYGAALGDFLPPEIIEEFQETIRFRNTGKQ